jgi:hypothetical protein
MRGKTVVLAALQLRNATINTFFIQFIAQHKLFMKHLVEASYEPAASRRSSKDGCGLSVKRTGYARLFFS